MIHRYSKIENESILKNYEMLKEKAKKQGFYTVEMIKETIENTVHDLDWFELFDYYDNKLDWLGIELKTE